MQPVPDASIACQHTTRSAFEDVLGQVVRADLALHVRTRDVVPLRSTSVLAADNLMIPQAVHCSRKCFMALFSIRLWMDFLLHDAVGNSVQPLLVPQLTLTGFPL